MREERKLEACTLCTNRCQRTHGKKSEPRPTATAFFKVMIGRFSEFLFLPPKFHREVVSLGDQSTLEDMRGQQWKVKLSMVNGCLAFQQGWTTFVSEHDVKFGEILIFNYISESHFMVQIFGTCGCERVSFSMGKNGDRQKGKRSRKVELSHIQLPSAEMQCHMVETRAMKKAKAMKSAATPENLLNCRMTRSKYQAEATGKSAAMLEVSSPDDENTRSDDSEIPDVMINKDIINRTVTVEGKMTCNSSDVEKSDGKEKSLMSTENSNYASSSRGTSDALDLPCVVVDEDPLIANKCNAEKVNSLTTPENPDYTHQKACCICHRDSGNGKDTAKTSFSLSSADVAPVGTKCDAEATGKLSTTLEKSFLYDTRSKRNLDVAKAPFYKGGEGSVDEKRAGKSRMSPSKPSYLKKVVNKCDTEVVDEVPASNNSLVYAIRPEGKLTTVIHNNSRTEKVDLENKAAHSKLSDCVMSLSNCNAPVVANILPGIEKSSCEVVSSKMRSDAFQISSDKIHFDEGEMRIPSHPSGLHSYKEVKIKLNAVPIEEVPTTIEESSCRETSSKITTDLPNAESCSKNTINLPNAECDKFNGNSIKEERAAILSKFNTESGDRAQNSTRKISDHTVSLQSYEDVNVKHNAAPTEEVPTTIDLSNAECDLVDGNSINEGGPTSWSKCNTKDGDRARNSMLKFSDHVIGSKMKQSMDYSDDNNSRKGDGVLISKTIHSNSSESQTIVIRCEEGTREKSHGSSSKMNSDGSQDLCYKNDENSVSKDGAAKHEITPTSLPDTGITETECTAEEMDKVLRTLRGNNHSENISTLASSELPCDIVHGNLDEGGVIGTDIASNAHDLSGGKCRTDALGSPHFVVDGTMKQEERDVRSQTTQSNFTGLKLSETDCHSYDMDKGQKVTNNSSGKGNNSSHLETSFTRIQTISSIGCSGPVNGNANISADGICGYSLSKEQKFVQSGNGLPSVLEEGNISSCSKIKQCKVELAEGLDSIEFSPSGIARFSCSIDERCQSRLELPQYLDYAVTKQKKKYDKVVILLRDPSMRVWPVLYHENRHVKIFGSGWSSFAKANNLQEGDTCTFQVVDALEALLQVHIKKG